MGFSLSKSICRVITLSIYTVHLRRSIILITIVVALIKILEVPEHVVIIVHAAGRAYKTAAASLVLGR